MNPDREKASNKKCRSDLDRHGMDIRITDLVVEQADQE